MEKKYKVIFVEPAVKKIIIAKAASLEMSQMDYVTAVIFESLGPSDLDFTDLTDEERKWLDWNYRRLNLGMGDPE